MYDDYDDLGDVRMLMMMGSFSNQGRTSVTVSHRLPSIVTSDMIYVIQKGQVYVSL